MNENSGDTADRMARHGLDHHLLPARLGGVHRLISMTNKIFRGLWCRKITMPHSDTDTGTGLAEIQTAHSIMKRIDDTGRNPAGCIKIGMREKDTEFISQMANIASQLTIN